MVLLIEYFKSKNNQRDLEYKACINENLKCDFIDKDLYIQHKRRNTLNIKSVIYKS